ncbi:CPBP family intramembrane glutamic endopeptidase [Clostridium sp. UBA4548]|uniref:CPBP family intramembrane glutamic endopeptidase n=1 Tax=Clostridium sp. UBA4548 TaxID=1946361 RepID=UPI0025BB42E0|nr:CPBP family intramembrane glutamic endopeptidase [Clostridium sp. UBA4548]
MELVKPKVFYVFSILYIIFISIISIYLNGFVEFDPSNYKMLLIAIILWLLLYIPIPISVMKAKYEISEFGFKITKALLISLPIFLIFILPKANYDISINTFYWAILISFARVGEEVFYRGFVYTLCLKLFKHKNTPWNWAIVLSSLLFAMMHTQYDLGIMVSTFILAIFLGLLRHITDSILIPIIIHCALAGGILTILLGIFIYFTFVLIAFLRKEKVFELVKSS